MNEFEQKAQRFEKWAKVLGLGIAGFLFAPVALATIQGLISLLVVGTIGLIAVNVGVPWFAASLKNWKLKALKAVAAANPIEQLENRYMQRKEALLAQRENIKQRIAIAAKILAQIQAYETKFHKESPRRTSYTNLNLLIDLSKGKYEKAMVTLSAYGQAIEEKRADWEIAKSLAEESKLAKVGEDFTSKLMEDTALSTIQNGLDLAFAELDAAVMDENIEKAMNGQDVKVAVPMETTPKATKAKSAALNELSFDYEGEPAPRQKVAVA